MRRAPFVLLLLLACDHGEPFGPGQPHNEGPRSLDLPRQLTFSPLDDRAPSIRGNEALYSQAPIDDDPRARCIAMLPVEGGQVSRISCPPATVDTFLQTWDEPSLSPDGQQIAFLWVRSPRFSALGAWTHEIVVAPADRPDQTTQRVFLGGTRPDGRHSNTVSQLHWVNAATVRFIAAYDSIWKVKNGGAARLTDSAVNPVTLMDLDVATGVLRDVPGGDSVAAWAPASGGGFWLVRQATRGRLERVDAAGTPTVVGNFALPVTALVEAGPWVVAGFGTGRLERMDPTDATSVTIPSPASGPVRRIAWHAATGRIIIAAEPTTLPFGASANLWLVALP